MKRAAIVTIFCFLFSFSPVHSSNALFGLECKKPRATYTDYLARSRISWDKVQSLYSQSYKLGAKPWLNEQKNYARLRGIAYTAVLSDPKCFSAKQIYDAKKWLN